MAITSLRRSETCDAASLPYTLTWHRENPAGAWVAPIAPPGATALLIASRSASPAIPPAADPAHWLLQPQRWHLEPARGSAEGPQLRGPPDARTYPLDCSRAPRTNRDQSCRLPEDARDCEGVVPATAG